MLAPTHTAHGDVKVDLKELIYLLTLNIAIDSFLPSISVGTFKNQTSLRIYRENHNFLATASSMYTPGSILL